MKVWLLIILFNNVSNDAKVAVFETQKQCEIQKGVTVAVLGKRKEVKSIECVQGTLKEE